MTTIKLTNPGCVISDPGLRIRRLGKKDTTQIFEYFIQLDRDTLRLRFGSAVGEDFLFNYSSGIMQMNSLAFGMINGERICGIGELRILSDNWPVHAEAAFSVDTVWQNKGIGKLLLNRVISAARNRKVEKLYMICLVENKKMQHLVADHFDSHQIREGEVEVEILPPQPTICSRLGELMFESRSYISTALTRSAMSSKISNSTKL